MNKIISTIRIIGGEWRSRRIHFADIPGLRPTQDMIRETLFNWLAPVVAGARCLDLFAGSGALGFEALSRGARFCCFVDHHTKVLTALRENSEKLNISGEKCAIINGLCPEQIPALPGAPFDIIFLDPPFQENLLPPTIAWLNQSDYLKKDAWVYIEMEKNAEIILPTHWEIHRQKQTSALTYQLIHTRRI